LIVLWLVFAALAQNKGNTMRCDCADAEFPESRYSWSFPTVYVASTEATRLVNDAIRADVLNALQLHSFREHRCHCALKRAEAAPVLADDYCELSYESSRYVSLLCSTERTMYGRGATEYRSLLFEIRGRTGRRVASDRLFAGPMAIDRLKTRLTEFVKAERQEGLASRTYESMVDDREVPQLVAAMIGAATLTNKGVHFLALGSHHSVFEVTLSASELQRDLARDVAKDLLMNDGQP
jgi:hypothetical protein